MHKNMVMNTYHSNVLELCQEALNDLRLIEASKRNPDDLEPLVANMRQRIRRISHLDANGDETALDEVEKSVPLGYATEADEIRQRLQKEGRI